MPLTESPSLDARAAAIVTAVLDEIPARLTAPTCAVLRDVLWPMIGLEWHDELCMIGGWLRAWRPFVPTPAGWALSADAVATMQQITALVALEHGTPAARAAVLPTLRSMPRG